MNGILAYGAYIPVHRLLPEDVAAGLGSSPSKGVRPVAAYDEDSTTLAVEAARHALACARIGPTAVHLATSAPAYLEKSNAATVHAALGLDAGVGVLDLSGSLRCGGASLLNALRSPDRVLSVSADIRVGAAGGPDELGSTDAAAAFLTSDGADDGVIAELISSGSATVEILDRWRLPEQPISSRWEENFGAAANASVTVDAIIDALKQAGITPDQVDRFLIATANPRVGRRLISETNLPRDRTTTTLGPGPAGAAQPGLLLADFLDRAAPDQIVVVAAIADGADVIVLRTTPQLTRSRAFHHVANQLENEGLAVPYARYLTWRGLLPGEQPRKAAPRSPSAPAAYRANAWKFAFRATRCVGCGTRHLPPQRVCATCGSVDSMKPEPMAAATGTVSACTIDRLAWSPSPPAVFAVVDFDGGGRAELEVTDCRPAEIKPGTRVEATFRRLSTLDGRHNYFWKVRPTTTEENCSWVHVE